MADRNLNIAHEYFTWKLVQDVAQENGYFEKAGVEPELSYFAPGTQDFDGENAYEVDWWDDLDEQGTIHGVCEWNAIQEASETGREILASYSEWDRVIFVKADSEAETLDDLRGRSIGINKYATSFYSLPEMLEEAGFEDDDIVLEHVGSAAERFDAVKNDEVDAIGVLEPFVTLGRYDDQLREVFDGPCRAAVVSGENIDKETADALRSALNWAVEEINNNLDYYRERYIAKLKEAAEANPEQFQDVNFDRLENTFELRQFLPVREPDEERIENTATWMRDRGFVREDDEINVVN